MENLILVSDEKLHKFVQLYKLCQEYIIDNRITNSISIEQCDDMTFETKQFVERMCNIIGYMEKE